MRPTNFDNFVGQQNAKLRLNLLKKSSEIRNAPIPHLLFSGASGTGKSTASRILAGQKNHVEVNAASIKNERDLTALVKSIGFGDVIFIDEIHALPKKVQECLYIIMEDFQIEQKINGIIKRFPVNEFTLIGATTHIGSLNPPLRNRFKDVIEFEEYELDDLALIVQRVAKANLGLDIGISIAKKIAGTCRGNPRHTVTRTEFIRDWILVQGEGDRNKMLAVCDKVNKENGWMDIIALQGVDEYGLESIEKKYVEILLENGVVPLDSLSAKLNVTMENVKEMEKYLMKTGLVIRTARGRCLDMIKYQEMYGVPNNIQYLKNLAGL